MSDKCSITPGQKRSRRSGVGRGALRSPALAACSIRVRGQPVTTVSGSPGPAPVPLEMSLTVSALASSSAASPAAESAEVLIVASVTASPSVQPCGYESRSTRSGRAPKPSGVDLAQQARAVVPGLRE